ncbi:MAG TPA: TIGR01620 family protein [Azospirillaceae bacterium]|nr:TIGR01620 family protein [Azospirillaceae bacterium]
MTEPPSGPDGRTTATPRWIAPVELAPDLAHPVPDAAPEGGIPPDEDGEPLDTRPAPRRRWRPGTWAAAGIGGLIVAAVGFDTADLIHRAFAVSVALGAAVSALLALAGAALTGLLVREVRAIGRLRAIDRMRGEAERLAAAGGHGGASGWLAGLRGLYRGRPDMAGPLDRLDRHLSDALDDVEAMRLAEDSLLRPLDRRAYALVLKAARDTAMGTAVSPSALLDTLIVLWRNLALVREVAALYGARPGYLGSLRLLRRMLANLAVAGAAEAGQGLAVEAVGGGLAAALSSRIGQGLLNGLLTARVGLAAMHLCRPLAFRPEERPSLRGIRRALLAVPKDLL